MNAGSDHRPEKETKRRVVIIIAQKITSRPLLV